MNTENLMKSIIGSTRNTMTVKSYIYDELYDILEDLCISRGEIHPTIEKMLKKASRYTNVTSKSFMVKWINTDGIITDTTKIK